MRSINEILDDIEVLSDFHMPQGDYDKIEIYCKEIINYTESLEQENAQMSYELEKLRDKLKEKEQKKQVKRKFPQEIEQIMKNQIVIMGTLQSMQDEIYEIPNIAETHKLIIENETEG